MIRNFASFVFVAALSGSFPVLIAQSQNPDQQQEAHPDTKPAPKTNQPNNAGVKPPTGQSPDIQQEKNGATGSSRKQKKNKNNARQAHGTPHPKTDTSTEH